MITHTVTDSGLSVTDRVNAEVNIYSPDWTPSAETHDVSRPTDEVVSGRTNRLQFGPVFVYVVRLDEEETHELGSQTGPIDLQPGEYLVDIDASVKTYVRFDGSATIRKTPDFQTLVIDFGGSTAVTIGFRSRHERPADTIRVPQTPEGVATALSYVHASMKSDGPDRSFPTLRGHPPRIEFADDLDVPRTAREAVFETGIELTVPRDLEYLFTVSPLAYYLQAKVSIDDGNPPTLRAPSIDLEHSFGAHESFQTEVSDLLRRSFFLDCLVRNAGPFGTGLADVPSLESLGLDEEIYHADPDQRLDRYRSVPRSVLEPHLPVWHLTMHVDPEYEYVRSLPFLLNKLSLVRLADYSPLERSELLTLSLDDFYRAGSVASVDIVKPTLTESRAHGWLADGVPIDAFKASHAAFENRLDYLERSGDGTTSVTVVVNDESMDEERVAVAEIYERRSRNLPIDVTIHRNCRRNELASIFESDVDFVHFIGHCEVDGLCCPDGTLAIDSIAESNVQTFFLNACGSFYEGRSLIEKGSVAGAVTVRPVLNEQAATVGATFARLLVDGFSIERALRLASRRIITGRDYAVVGDGTHVLTHCENIYPATITIEDREDDRFRLRYEILSTWTCGGIYQFYTHEQASSHLVGTTSTYEVSTAELRTILARSQDPLLVDGTFLWPEEFEDRL